MWQAQEFVRRIGKTLQGKDDDITHEPLPKRWVDLIHHLDEKERTQSLAPELQGEPPQQLRTNVKR